MDRLNVIIIGVYKMRCENNEDFVSDRHRVIYTGEEKKREGLILDQNMKKCILEYYQLFDRILVVKINGKFLICPL